MTHSSTEAGFPFKFGGTLWDACAGLVSQVMFSIPMREIRLDQDASEGVHAAMWTISSVQELRDLGIPFDPALDVRFEDPDSDGDTNPGGGGMLERYVSRLLRGAYESSPLFWHHALRHVPSPSLACRGQARQAQPARRHLEFKDPNGLVADGMGPLPPVPIHGYASFPVGGFGVDCFCGWPQDAASRCVIPADACSALVTLRLITACEYDPGNQSQAVHTESLLLRSWNASWECPEMSLSDAWGVVPSSPVALSHWLLGQTSANISSDVTELLIRGRAGLRVGNIRSLARGAAGEQINPTSRRHPARSPDGKSSASLRCRDEFLGSFDAASVARRMVDDLFPASQAVSESPVTSACLRFTVEYSRLRIVEMLSAIRDTSIEAGEQDSITNTWRRRCEVQLDMMGMCRAHGVFQMIPREKRAYDCPFSVTDGYQGGGYYVTPGCLVYKREEDAFFDPCGVAGACSPAQGPAPMPLSSITKRVPFDPRRASRGDPIGYWPIRFEAGASAVPSRMDSVRDLLQQYDEGSPVPRGLTPDFVHNLVHRGGANSPGFGNVPEGRTWGTSEGMASESTHMCDGISDWWPEDWNQPVGYHVTLPCHSSEAGYRTFDSAFAVEDTGDTVRMIYYHGALRDRRSSHSEFGGSGFCRRGSYGMPRALTNTMRVCVRDAHLASYDAHVPLHPTYGLNRSRSPQFSEERLCAGSPYDVPWTVVDEDAAPVSMLSVGGVPMWDGVLAGMSSYPSANYVSQVRTLPHQPSHTNPPARTLAYEPCHTNAAVQPPLPRGM